MNDKVEQKFGVRFKTKKATATNGSTITEEGEKCWLINEDEGWVPATSLSVDFMSGAVPKSLKVFDSPGEAEKFMCQWAGHPWYAVPKSWEILRVYVHTKQVFSHYSLA